MFQPVSASANLPKQEEEILRFWKEQGIYEKSLAQRAGEERFVFFEGPPTANGMPHPGHCLTRAIKDVFPRYKTMRGFLCERKAGWDTHGLPVEVEVCKELGIHSKEEIENYGIEPFIHRCQESVWRYMKEWERLTERLGFWIHLDEAYVTYHQSYVESVWWSLKSLFDRRLLYQDEKVVWWWAQGGTALSSGEVGQGYREVDDPSVYVRFPLLNDNGAPDGTNLLVWTTTPWTLPSNQFVAVKRQLWYEELEDETTGERLIIASDLVSEVKKKKGQELKRVRLLQGKELIGRRYKPPFDYFYDDRKENVAQPNEGNQWGTYIYLYASNDLGLGGEELEQWLAANQKRHIGWHLVPADFVTTETGTGLVHIAPAFGVDDLEILKREQRIFGQQRSIPKLICPVIANGGKFTHEVPEYEGRWVKSCDKDIIAKLNSSQLLFHREQYRHEYPFCWRAEEDPLISFPRRSWFIHTRQFKDLMLDNNRSINWLPEHIRDGRFGNFLWTNVDWALSRERYWGTPLPIWVCQQTGQMEAVASYEELLAKPGAKGQEVWETAKKSKPGLPDDLRVHKPYIDAVTYDSPFADGARMNRVSEVIDCWYDSGAMPFAQWGYRGNNGPVVASERFREQFPADFISEALDQTRGWFYSQLAISTLVFGPEPLTPSDILARPKVEQKRLIGLTVQSLESPEAAAKNALALSKPQSNPAISQPPFPHPFKNCIVLGLMLGEDGRKMSKRDRNYREPAEIFDKYGADALRWFFFANQPPWTTIRYAERAIKDTIPEFILRLWNCFSFFVNYANSNDRFEPETLLSGSVGQLGTANLATGKGFRPAAERGELDRWILSELNRTAAAVVERMDAYDNYEACKRLNAFVDGLSNWYVRRSRDRFWAAMDAAHQQDKLDAYWTLYESLLTTAKLIAPFTPFLAEAMWQKLTGVFGERAAASVHLCDYPTGDPAAIDEQLSERMRLLRDIASLGLSARMANKLKVRQPLAKVEVILSDMAHQKWLEAHDELLRDELNVKKIEYTKEADKYITYQVQPNFKRLGPRIGKLLPAAKQALGQADGGKLLAELTASGKVTLELGGEKIELDNEDIQVRLQAKPGWAAAQGSNVVVVLATELTPDLLAEGLARDFVRVVQDERKKREFEFTDRIEIGIKGASAELQKAIEAFREYVCGETLAVKLVFEALENAESVEVEIGDEKFTLYVRRHA